jgi:hypothetical protein
MNGIWQLDMYQEFSQKGATVCNKNQTLYYYSTQIIVQTSQMETFHSPYQLSAHPQKF